VEIILAERYNLEPMSATEFFADEQDRSPGFHISEATRALDEQYHPVKYKQWANRQYSGREQEQLQDRTEIGWLWENLLQGGTRYGFRDRMLKRRSKEAAVVAFDPHLHLQQEFQRFGTFLTPDGVDTFEDRPWIEEYKAARFSIRKWEKTATEFWEWHARVKCYCKVVGTDRVRFFVYWVCGDWAGSGPQCWRYDILYTQEEIDHAWAEVIQWAAANGKLPAEIMAKIEKGRTS
jgi:hypothetical protein